MIKARIGVVAGRPVVAVDARVVAKNIHLALLVGYGVTDLTKP